MATYNPLPANYTTFQKIEKIPKQSGKKEEVDKKLSKENGNKKSKSPGPGDYQMIHSWKGKDKIPKGSISYIDKITKGPAPTVYYH